MNYEVKTLQSILSYGNLSVDTADELASMIRKEKEKKVLEKHKFIISGPFRTGNRLYYTTRAPWTPSCKIGRSTYNDLIDTLYDHYFADPVQDYTVQQMFDLMIGSFEKEHIVSNLTLTHYKADWKKFIVDKKCAWLNMPINKVLPDQIFEHYRIITADCSIKRSTFNNVKTVVNAVFDFAINKNVCCIKASLVSTKRLRFAPVYDKWEGVYTSEDRQKILETCENMTPTVYIKAIELMFCLDIRVGELRALQKNDVDLDERTINVAHQMIDIRTDSANRHSVRSNLMKGKQETGKRVEPLSDRAVRVIEWLIKNYPNTTWLLPNRSQNEPIYTNRFNENLKKVCNKAGVKYYSSHGIRFHIISSMYDAGIPEKSIQRLSGHADPDMTRHYNKRISNDFEDDKIRTVMN